MKAWAKVQAALDRFFLTPGSPRPLAALRIGIAGLLLLQVALLHHYALDFLARDGLVQGALAQFLSVPFTPHLTSLFDLLAPFGVSEVACIYAVCWLYVASLVAMLLGWHTRAATVFTWFLHWTLISSAHSIMYGVDVYAHVFLFYLMLVPCGDALSLDVWSGRRTESPSMMARLGLRVMQLHLCITYLSSGIEKAQGPQWWNGELLWRALVLPVYRQYDFTWLANVPLLSVVAGWGTLVAELGYCVFIWPRTTRRLWVPMMVSLHLGIAVFLGLTLFGIIMSILTVAVFGLADWDQTPGSWRRLLEMRAPPLAKTKA